MGWLQKLFKGSSHKNTRDVSYRHVNEDIDRAIALSLEDEEQKANRVMCAGTQLEEDEQLARAIQESLIVDSARHHQYENRNRNVDQTIPYPYSSQFRICAGCHSEIGYGQFLSCMDNIWHPKCFRCLACNQPIADHEFSLSGKFAYHKSCYMEHHHPRCDVCMHFIATNGAGLIEYRAHPFWVQKYCPSHERDETPRCCSCERMEPRGTRYVELEDGRKLCLECLDSAIMDTYECQPLYLAILKFYERLHMKVVQDVPLLLVERHALNEALVGEKSGHHNIAETRGLCLSEEQTVSTVRIRGSICLSLLKCDFGKGYCYKLKFFTFHLKSIDNQLEISKFILVECYAYISQNETFFNTSSHVYNACSNIM